MLVGVSALPQVLGEGELRKPLTIKAAKFSSSATEKIAAAGATAEAVPQRAKWTRRAHEKVREPRRACVFCFKSARLSQCTAALLVKSAQTYHQPTNQKRSQAHSMRDCCCCMTL